MDAVSRDVPVAILAGGGDNDEVMDMFKVFADTLFGNRRLSGRSIGGVARIAVGGRADDQVAACA